MLIYCCACERDVEARLTTGAEIYPHRADLSDLPFWRCDKCRNYVGCHHKTANRTRPLGCIATKEITQARMQIHAVIDPVWKSGKLQRREVYRRISEAIGYQFHSGEIRSLEAAREVLEAARQMVAPALVFALPVAFFIFGGSQ